MFTHHTIFIHHQYLGLLQGECIVLIGLQSLFWSSFEIIFSLFSFIFFKYLSYICIVEVYSQYILFHSYVLVLSFTHFVLVLQMTISLRLIIKVLFLCLAYSLGKIHKNKSSSVLLCS